MHYIESLCPPAFIYLLYMVVHIGLDIAVWRPYTALMKLPMGVVGVFLLDALCGVDLGIISWAIVVTPFLMVALATSISLGLQMDEQIDKIVKEKFGNQACS